MVSARNRNAEARVSTHVLHGVQDLDEGDSAVIHHRFIKAALGSLVALLLEQLMKQEEEQDREDGAWNLAMAAGTCLDLIATVVEDDIIALVMPFVQVSKHGTSPLSCIVVGEMRGECGAGGVR